MYFVVAFHPTGLVQKRWIRSENQVIGLIKEGFIVYRSGFNDQIATIGAENRIVWTDLKETEDLK